MIICLLLSLVLCDSSPVTILAGARMCVAVAAREVGAAGLVGRRLLLRWKKKLVEAELGARPRWSDGDGARSGEEK